MGAGQGKDVDPEELIKEIQRLRTQISKAEGSLKQEHERPLSASAEASLQQELATKDKKLSDLATSLGGQKASQEQLDRLNAELTEVKASIRKTEAAKLDLSNKVDDERKKAQHALRQRDEAQATADAQTAKSDKLQFDIKSLLENTESQNDARIVELEQAIAETRREIEGNEAHIAELQDKCNEEHKAVDAEEREAQQLLQELKQRHETEITDLSQQAERLTAELVGLGGSSHSSLSEEQSNQALHAQVNEKEEQIKTLETSQTELEAQLSEARNSLAEIQRASDLKEAKIKGLEAEVGEMTSEELVLKSAIEQASSEATVRETQDTAQIAELEAALAEGERNSAESQSSVQQRDSKISELETKLADLRRSQAEAETALEAVKGETAKLEKAHQAKDASLEESQASLISVQSELANASLAIQAKYADLNAQRAEVERLTSVLAEKEKELEAAKEDSNRDEDPDTLAETTEASVSAERTEGNLGNLRLEESEIIESTEVATEPVTEPSLENTESVEESKEETTQEDTTTAQEETKSTQEDTTTVQEETKTAQDETSTPQDETSTKEETSTSQEETKTTQEGKKGKKAKNRGKNKR
jgi:chromosome segregation ATPase